MNPRIVALCGSNLAVSAIGASLRRNPEIQVRDFEADFSRIEMNIKADPPAAILFDLATTPVHLVLSVFRAYPKVMLIGVDLASKKMMVLSGGQSSLLAVDDLIQAIKGHAPLGNGSDFGHDIPPAVDPRQQLM